MPVRATNGSQSASGSSTLGIASSFISLNNMDAAESFNELQGLNPTEQLEALDNHLAKQTAIIQGAQDVLSYQIDNSLRKQVESELGMAKSRIEAINSRKNNIQTSIIKPTEVKPPVERSEDFQTALQGALGSLASLVSLGKSNDTQTLNGSAPSTSSNSAPSNVQSELDKQWVEGLSKLADFMRRTLRVRYELNVSEVVRAVIPALADRRSKQCRAAAYRLIRYTMVDAHSVQIVQEENLEWYIVRSLTRDSKFAVEKEQVIKFIRTIVEVGTVRRDATAGRTTASVPLSEPIMRAFIAVAEHAEDPFRQICIQTLAEIFLMDIDLVARTGGIRFLLQALGEGPIELAPILASTFLHIVESPRTREYLNVGTDLEMALAAVTDAYGRGTDHLERMKSSTKVIQLMLRSWSGLMYFCMDHMRAIKSIIDVLRIPSLETRELILDMFFDLFNIKTPAWSQTFIDGRRLTMYRRSQDTARNEDDGAELVNYAARLTDQYIGLLVRIFTHAGLLDALSGMLEETTTGTSLSRKATLLISEVLDVANRTLPMAVAAQIQTIPQVFYLAADYSEPEHRIVGTNAMAAIDSLNRNRTKLEPTHHVKGTRARANSVEDAVRRGQRQVEKVKLKMSMQMDDKAFQSALLDTQVMLTKEHTKWKFETLQELIDGPLLNPKRMEEAIKGARFIRRLMSFFHPFSHRFSDVKREDNNGNWVKLGCSLLTTLMSSPEGIRYLSTEDQLLSQLVKSFAQLDPFNGVPESDPIFSKRRFAETLTYGYFEMLGVLSKHKEGIELLEKFKIFTAFYHLSELKSREDLTKAIIENLDYSTDGHPRIILSKALTSSYKHVREYATEYLGSLIRSSPTANAWTLRLLITQLYDPAQEVCAVAVRLLEEVCESKDILQLVVEMRPTLDHLDEVGDTLLLKFISTDVGFRFLFEAGYIDRQMDSWFNERNLFYVVQVEVYLAKVFTQGPSEGDDDHDLAALEGSVPPHFYGEMAKTEPGCQILQGKGHFTDFAEFIRHHGDESEDPELIMKLKSILWAVGNVGATEGGLAFLEDEDIIPAVLRIADESPIPSVRGTCFFVLGLISSTSQGAEILDDCGWEAILTPLGLATGLCIPRDFEKFLYMPPWKQRSPETFDNRLIPPSTEPEIEAITAVYNLANTVIANAASRSLARMKSRPDHRALFSSPDMLYRALHTMSTQRYRLPVRRYILEIFSVNLDADLVVALQQSAYKLKPHPSAQPLKPAIVNRMSMFGRLGRSRRHSDDESGEDVSEDDEVETGHNAYREYQPPTLNLQPLQRIIGFDI